MVSRVTRWIAAISTAVIVLTLFGSASSAAAMTTLVDCGNGDDLQAAIDAAGSGDTLEIQGTCTGNFTITGKDLTLVGVGPHPTLSGGGSGRPLTTGSTTTMLSGLTLIDGNETAGGGGGLLVGGLGDVTLESCTINNNATSFYGGGIFAVAGGHVTVKNSTITDNTAA